MRETRARKAALNDPIDLAVEQVERDLRLRLAMTALAGFVYLTRIDVSRMLGMSNSAINEIPDFPPPIRLSTRRIAWRSDQVLAWMKARAATVASPDDDEVEGDVAEADDGATRSRAA